MITPNSIQNGNGFYISYNSVDTRLYGSDTTALVDNNMTTFFILNGDHREAYKPLIPKGFEACLEYFKENQHLMNKYSDKLKLKPPHDQSQKYIRERHNRQALTMGQNPPYPDELF